MSFLDFKRFLLWKKEENPKRIIDDNIRELYELEKSDEFKLYRNIIEWRIHNVAEQLLRRPSQQEYHKGYVDGLRLILQDFKRIKEEYEKRYKNK